jgi:phosphopantothenoylcysteine decarboxylase/phosphopantothenate--cysteine ligase
MKREMLDNVHILLGVSGGIAAYKAVDLASKLTAAGAKVRTVMTQNACRLVGPKSFEAVTRSTVLTTLWQTQHSRTGPVDAAEHIALARWAEIVVVAPATANIIAKITNGICDDVLSTTVCACWSKPVLVAPAMNNNMWDNPAVQQNVQKVKQMGFQIIGPAKGRLANGTEAIGRMAEPEDIFKAIENIASKIRGGTQ